MHAVYMQEVNVLQEVNELHSGGCTALSTASGPGQHACLQTAALTEIHDALLQRS